MHIAIIGTGKMARGIGYALRETTHDITFGSRDPAVAEALAKSMKEEHGRVYRGTGVVAAAARADLAILAVPWSAALASIETLRDALDSKILLDLTNPLNASYDGLLVGEGTSASEELARAAGDRVRVVAALKNTFAGTFAEPGISGGPPPDVLVAGDDAAAKKTVMELVRAMGFGALEAGPLATARTLERMTLLLIHLANANGWHWNAGFKLLH